MVGAYGDDDRGPSSGSAYFFTRSGGVWTQQAKLTASDGGSYDFFGNSVALDGDTALIGSMYDDDRRGSAFIFTRSGTGCGFNIPNSLLRMRAADDWLGVSVCPGWGYRPGGGVSG